MLRFSQNWQNPETGRFYDPAKTDPVNPKAWSHRGAAYRYGPVVQPNGSVKLRLKWMAA